MLVLCSDVECAGRNRVSNRPADLLRLHNYVIYKYKYELSICLYIIFTEIINRSLTYVHVRVVTKIEGSTPGDTAATTSSQFRRSDRGGFPYDISLCICMITLARVGRRL